jgi:MFS family permease
MSGKLKKLKRRWKFWTKDQAGRNILYIYLYGAFTNSIFYWVLSNTIFLSRGMSPTQLVILNLIFGISFLFFVIPGGIFGDKFGKRNALFICLGFGILKIFLILIADSFFLFTLSSIFNAAERGFERGNRNGLLYESFKVKGQLKKYMQGTGLYEFIRMGVYSVIAIIGGILGSLIGLDFLIWISFPGLIFAFFTVLKMRSLAKRRQRKKRITIANMSILKNSLRTVKKRKGLSMIIFYQALIVVILIFLWDYNELYFDVANLPIALFGVATAFMSLAEGIPQIFSAKLFGKMPRKRAFASLMITCNISLAAAVFLPGIAGLFFFLLTVTIISFSFPLCAEYMNHRAPSVYRATILSIANFIEQGLYIVLGLAFAFLIEIWGVRHAYLLIAVVGLIYGTIYFFSSRKSKVSKNIIRKN